MSKKLYTEEDVLKYLVEKTGKPVEELKAELEEEVALTKKDPKFAESTDEFIRTIARNKFSTRKLRELSSNAIEWRGFVFGKGDLVDTVARQKMLTEAAFKADAMKTIQGWMYSDRLVLSNNEGKPLYPKTPANEKMRRVGKPLPTNSWLRTIIGVAQPIDPKTKVAGPPQPFRIMINGTKAIDVKKVPANVYTSFKGLNKTRDEDRKAGEYRINWSAFTSFREIMEASKDIPTIEEILRGVTARFKSLGELEEYHDTVEKDYGRWVITEGNVAFLNLEPNSKTGNMMMILSDESLMFTGDKTGVMCWIPTDRGIVIDFAQDSRILVVGKTTRGKARDPITGEFLDTPGDVMINVYGIYAPELFKVTPDVVPITAKSITPEGPQKDDTKKNW